MIGEPLRVINRARGSARPRDRAQLDRKAMEAALASARAVLSGRADLVCAYAFGSVVDVECERIQDVDIAVLAREPLTLAQEGDLYVQLARELGTDCIDVVDLATARRELAHEVLSVGRLLADRDPAASARFRERILHDHLAHRHHTRLYYRLLRESFHGTYVHAPR